MSMKNAEFKALREGWKLTQESVAQRFGVTRTTVQNWESGATPIGTAVDMMREVWESRLRQEDPDRGPLTLIYSDGPMFVNPSRPRLAMMKQEAYATNAGALARVQQLWGREDFHNPFIIEKSSTPLWNAVQLQGVANGSDTDAPTLRRLLSDIAGAVRRTSGSFASGRLTTAEKEQRKKSIEDLAAELDQLSTISFDDTAGRLRVENIFHELQRLGLRPPDALVYNVAQAFVATEQD
jgi:DNA-binding XRE family transcriptional regulator